MLNRPAFGFVLFFLLVQSTQAQELPTAPQRPLFVTNDWLLDSSRFRAEVYCSEDKQSLVLDNGLVRRVIRIAPNAATIALDDLRTGSSLLRSVRPEAIIKIDGQEHKIGGLVGQTNHAFLDATTIASLQDDPQAFAFEKWELVPVEKPLEWKRVRRAEERPWPPQGKGLRLWFCGRAEPLSDIRVVIQYEIYDGIPVIAKTLEIHQGGTQPISIDGVTVEQLACAEPESSVEPRDPNSWRSPPLEVISDYMFRGMDAVTANKIALWENDPSYTTQVSYTLQTPCLLSCRLPIGPGVELAQGQSFRAFKVFLILQDSTDRERQGLTMRRVYRTLAPWTTENPLMMHVRNSDRESFRRAVDQCAEVGFEMIIYTFGSGFNMESQDQAYIARIKEDVEYAHQKGIQVGGYSLFSSRRIDDENDVINPATGKPGGAIFGNAPCLCSRWGEDYLQTIKTFMEKTGLDLLEHDGPYPGDVCASTSHPGHRGVADSQWQQYQASKKLYAWCRAQGIYVNQPDYYFLVGGNKTAMGYRETNWSLPRGQQLIHARQNIYDGTWTKLPTMGWMFVPLTEYHGGGAAATMEPLSEHLDDYERQLQNNLGAGVQACYRGPRLYDTPATQELVTRYVNWFKQYRDILESDIIHGRRADGRDIDYLIHVNPALETPGMVVIYNPLPEPVTRTIQLPLYYTGLSGEVQIQQETAAPQTVALDGQGRAVVEVAIPAQGMTWLVLKRLTK
ncbi:MAG: hypothetical protein JNL67_00265 [Planctomycetaceae bacterium]|nr:hypothetical protein [Planctomycetaceae bacterium]